MNTDKIPELPASALAQLKALDDDQQHGRLNDRIKYLRRSLKKAYDTGVLSKEKVYRNAANMSYHSEATYFIAATWSAMTSLRVSIGYSKQTRFFVVKELEDGRERTRIYDNGSSGSGGAHVIFEGRPSELLDNIRVFSDGNTPETLRHNKVLQSISHSLALVLHSDRSKRLITNILNHAHAEALWEDDLRLRLSYDFPRRGFVENDREAALRWTETTPR